MHHSAPYLNTLRCSSPSTQKKRKVTQ